MEISVAIELWCGTGLGVAKEVDDLFPYESGGSDKEWGDSVTIDW